MVDRLRPKSVRSPGDPCAWSQEQVGSISDLIEYTDVASGAATVLIGTLPAGARYLDSSVQVITAFNAGSGDALTVGIASDYDYIVTDGHPTVADSETDGELLDWTPTSDQLIYARYTHSSTAPTTGKAIVTVRFKQPL